MLHQIKQKNTVYEKECNKQTNSKKINMAYYVSKITTTTPVKRPLFQDNLGKPVAEK